MTVPTLVLIPGLGSDAAVWQPTIDALGDRVQCVVGDTRRDATLQAMARRILDQTTGPFALAGVSMGGMVALEIMTIAPERITHLALIDTMAGADSFGQRLYRRFTNTVVRLYPNFRALVERSAASLLHPQASTPVKTAFIEMGVRVGPTTYIQQNRALVVRRDRRPTLFNITVPTAVIVGEADQLTPVAASRDIHECIDRCTLHIVPQCGHLPPLEQPQTCASLLEQLLTRKLNL